MFDLGMAVQNLCLKAHAMGLGPVVVGLMDLAPCGKILGIPEGHEVVAVNPVGRPAPEDQAPRAGCSRRSCSATTPARRSELHESRPPGKRPEARPEKRLNGRYL